MSYFVEQYYILNGYSKEQAEVLEELHAAWAHYKGKEYNSHELDRMFGVLLQQKIK